MIRTETGATAPQQALPAWSNPDLPPDQFLYDRAGPWPQPAPAYPEEQAREVLNVPQMEEMLWTQAIGARYLNTQLTYGPTAAAKATKDITLALPSDADFVRLMTTTVYSRFLRQEAPGSAYWYMDFSAMELLDPLPGTYCAPLICRFKKHPQKYEFALESIEFTATAKNPELVVRSGDPAWTLAKAYALQGAAYHALFVVHTALHFPMDSVNAITKAVVPHTHPLFQTLYPHTAYTLALDNAVQEGAASIVSNNAPGNWFDPLTANAYTVKRLFGVGYSGYRGLAAYPPFDYMSPWMDGQIPYGQCLGLYLKAFLDFCSAVAAVIPENDPYVARWARYCSANVRGFPSEIHAPAARFETTNLAAAMAIYMWDVTVAHGVDHYSFARHIPLGYKLLIIRRPPPQSVNDGGDISRVGDLTRGEDLARAEMASEMFFSAWTMPPNLIQTEYAYTDAALWQAVGSFHDDLRAADQRARAIMDFMPLEAEPGSPGYQWTIPASIQY